MGKLRFRLRLHQGFVFQLFHETRLLFLCVIMHTYNVFCWTRFSTLILYVCMKVDTQKDQVLRKSFSLHATHGNAYRLAAISQRLLREEHFTFQIRWRVNKRTMNLAKESLHVQTVPHCCVSCYHPCLKDLTLFFHGTSASFRSHQSALKFVEKSSLTSVGSWSAAPCTC